MELAFSLGLWERSYKPAEVARRFGKHPQTIERWRRSGRLDYLRAGREVRYPDEAIERFLRRESAGENNTAATTLTLRTPGQRKRDLAAAEAELDRRGI